MRTASRAPVAVRMGAAMYYILEWMLASSIPHVDGAGIWLPYFALNIIYVCKIIAFVNFQD